MVCHKMKNKCIYDMTFIRYLSWSILSIRSLTSREWLAQFFFKLLIHLLKILFFHFIDIQHIQMVIYLELVISAIIVPVQQRQRRQHYIMLRIINHTHYMQPIQQVVVVVIVMEHNIQHLNNNSNKRLIIIIYLISYHRQQILLIVRQHNSVN